MLTVDAILNDLYGAARAVRSAPALAMLVVAILTLGLGAATMMFALVDGILLQPLPFPDSSRLVFLNERIADGEEKTVAYLNFKDWRQRAGSFTGMAAYAWRSATLIGAGEPVRVQLAWASASLFDVLGATPQIGRTFASADDRFGAERVIVLSQRFWTSRLQADPDVLGRQLLLDDRAYVVIGVMPAGFGFPDVSGEGGVDGWVPMDLFADVWAMGHRADHPGIGVVGRLRPQVALDRVRSEMETIATALAAEYPDTNSGHGVNVVPLHERVVESTRSVLLLLLGAVGSMLLVACVNVAGLLLARATRGRREVAIRAALGASRARLVRLSLFESLLLSLSGCVGALLLARAGLAVLRGLGGALLPRLAEVHTDMGTLAFGGALAVATGVLAGLAPALDVVRRDLNETLRGGRGAAGSRRTTRLRDGLVIAERHLGAVLLAAAGLTANSLARVVTQRPGLDAAGVMTAQIVLPADRYADGAALRAFQRSLLAEVAAVQGIASSGTIWPLPLSNDGWGRWYHVEGEPPTDPARIPTADFAIVSPGAFDALGVRRLRGRAFGTDDDGDSAPVVIVSQFFAERYWPAVDPIGKRLKLGTSEEDVAWRQVVGVVETVRNRGMAGRVREQIYVPFEQEVSSRMTVVARGASGALIDGASLRRAVAAVDPEQPLSSMRTLASWRASQTATERLTVSMLGGFAGLAQLLAALGVYGVLAYSVARRRHEIGIRMALGAGARATLTIVLRQALRLVLFGLAIGIPGALVAGRLIEGRLYGIGGNDPLTFAAVVLVALAVGTLAALTPSWRAAKVHPATALRAD